MNIEPTPIHAVLLTGPQRITHTAQLFGVHFPLLLEPTVYAFADRLCGDYRGGYWHFYQLSNGGFYMAPDTEPPLHVNSPNGYECKMTADGFGIVVILFTYSHLSFLNEPIVAQTCAEHFHWLREYAFGHSEADKIFRAID